MYIDSVRRGAKRFSARSVATTGDVRIGGKRDYWLRGAISCLQFYSRVLTQLETRTKANCRECMYPGLSNQNVSMVNSYWRKMSYRQPYFQIIVEYEYGDWIF